MTSTMLRESHALLFRVRPVLTGGCQALNELCVTKQDVHCEHCKARYQTFV